MLKSVKKYNLILFLLVAVFISEAALAQFNIPEKPSKAEQTAVYDYVGLLSEYEANALKRKLINYADTTSTQIVIAIISSTNGEDISFLGAKWGQEWGIGQADEDNGIFILLARDDRTVDINTGYGIEYRITDRMAEQVINRYMIPEFKNGNYYAGLDSATTVMIQMLAGEFKGERKSDFPYSRVIIIALFLLFWFIMIRASRKGRGGRNGGSGGGMGSLWDIIVLSNAGRTGGSWSSGSGGTFGGGGSFGGGSFGGGFGGGGFGGGGASGSW
jgi:uncharacterized protein